MWSPTKAEEEGIAVTDTTAERRILDIRSMKSKMKRLNERCSSMRMFTFGNIFVLLLSIGRVSVAGQEQERTPNSLYGPNDQILILNADNFAKNVYNQKRAFFIEFFSSWCGACIGYAETYKKLAQQLKQWSPVVQIAAVDCAEDRNLELCREHSVDAYPTIKYFKFMSTSPNDATKYTGNKYNVDEVPLEIAQIVQNDWTNQKPKEWPSFEPIESSLSLDDIWRLVVPNDTSLLALFVENFPARITWAEAAAHQTIRIATVPLPESIEESMDLVAQMIGFAYEKRLHVAYIRSNHPDAQRFGITGQLASPRLFLLKRGAADPVHTSAQLDTWLQIQEKINEQLATFDAEEKQFRESQRNAEAAEEEKPKVTWSQFEVQMMDIMTALRYILIAEIPRKAVIDGENLAALKLWIHAIKMYAPGTIPMRRLFYRLDRWLNTVPQEVTAQQWIAQVKTIQEQLGQPLPANMTYVACRGSKPHLRGFSCGVWTLIHTMSVQAYELEKSNPKYNANNDLIEPFHQFIWHFFSCAECAKHFHGGILKQNMTTVVTAGDGILWLWRTHNIVNKFIAKTPTDDPAFPKQQFPSPSLCSTCRKPDGEFDERAVLEFLINYYRNLRVDGLQSVPGYRVNDFENGKLVNVEMKHLNPKFQIAAFNVDELEEADARRQNDLDSLHRWNNVANRAYGGGRYDASSPARRPFYVLWLSIIAVVVLFVYMKYRRNRSKIWKTFYYYNDYKL